MKPADQGPFSVQVVTASGPFSIVCAAGTVASVNAAQCGEPKTLPARARANADYFVHAANTLPKLVALLKEASASIAGGIESEDDLEAEWSKEDRALLARVDKLLAEIEGAS